MKALTSSLKYFIVQKAQVSNHAAIAYILDGLVLVNGRKGTLNQVVLPEDEVTLDGGVLKEPTEFLYLAYHKPPGIESTLNEQIANNLRHAIQCEHDVFPVGRLDKDSEGLMLLTNDGQVFNKLSHAHSHQEKEYFVTVDAVLTPAALLQLANGIDILGQVTRPATVLQLDGNAFTIVLTQGLNRQIRRMCYKLGYRVTRLIRTRIKSLKLSDLPAGQWRPLSTVEVEALWQGLPA